jgi:hypothetical protein
LNTGASIELTGNYFSANSAVAGNGGCGGGVSAQAPDILLQSNEITGSTGVCAAGASLFGHRVTLLDNYLHDNTATGGFGFGHGGGAVLGHTNAPQVTLRRNRIIGNSGSNIGAGIYILAENATLDANTIAGNVSSGGVGGPTRPCRSTARPSATSSGSGSMTSACSARRRRRSPERNVTSPAAWPSAPAGQRLATAAAGALSRSGPAPAGAAWEIEATAGGGQTFEWIFDVDLRATAGALSLSSWLAAARSQAEVQVSLDGAAWQTLIVVPASDDWRALTVDLGAFAGQQIQVRFAFHAVAAPDGAAADRWLVRDVRVVPGPPVVAGAGGRRPR